LVVTKQKTHDMNEFQIRSRSTNRRMHH